MTHINIFESKEEELFISKNGTDIAKVTLLPQTDVTKRIGIAKEKLILPEDFDEVFDILDAEITELFENGDEL